ncbi:WD40/YVTN/BNR-like repeat-containing protein [Fodinicola acaciae]|uniref:WD40/YVTN/BNR-like repeat-containing protein n=1 Tax=Fodinicola acaciae TaxID=2681555 RepID=UPI0013D3475B|nr:sialidase family protein [Fodinicola acaciae]
MLELRELAQDVRDSVVVPDFAEVVRSGERIRRRRVATTIGTTAAAVVVGVAAIGTAGPHTRSTTPAKPVPAQVYVDAMIPVDSHHAFVPQRDENGVVGVSFTADGGRSWQWTAPPPNTRRTDSVDVLGPTTISFGGYVSDTSGRLWTRVEGTPTTGVATTGSTSRQITAYVNSAVKQAVPDGWTARSLCENDTACEVYAVDPATGAWHPLAHQPPTPTEVTVDSAGRMWAAKRVVLPGDKPSCALSVSTDRGASWSTYPIPGSAGCVNAPSTTSDGTAYALVATAGATDKTPGVLVSHDSGRTWQRQALGMALSDLYVLPDGTMIGRPPLNSPDPATTLLRSTDGGKTFTPIPGTAHAAGIERTVTGAYAALVHPATGGMNAARLIVSDDGLHWSQIAMPAR